VLIFVDGLGVGRADPEVNPMARSENGCLSMFSEPSPNKVCFGGIPRPLDACLGVEGLPQSATGQTALLTGVNASEILGYHLFGFPNKRLREIILERSILRRAKEAGRTAAFLNVFRPRFFELGDSVWDKIPLSVTTWVNRAAGLPFFTLEDIRQERAIYQEFTNKVLRYRGFDVPLFSPEKAGSILARRSEDYELLLYEYFRTDAAGHSQNMEKAFAEIHRLESFLKAFLEEIDLTRTLVVLTSDHGNIEDLSVRTHTLNPAMTLLWGRGAEAMADGLESILDVPGRILECLGVDERKKWGG
jgi:hypothetical protein